MINVTDKMVFNFSDTQLSAAIQKALRNTSKSELSAYGFEGINLNGVSTKTHLRAAFSKFIELCTLQARHGKFDEGYVQNAFDIYQIGYEKVSEDQFYAFTFGKSGGPYQFRLSYAKMMRRGAGKFLIALHCLGAITLPVLFDWGSIRDVELKRPKDDTLVCSELLSFIRSLDPQSDKVQHPAFALIGVSRKRREWFLSYGTKLLLATGWQRPSDACIRDLLKIREAELQSSSGMNLQSVYKAFVDVLERKYGKAIRISVESWGEALRNEVSKGRISPSSKVRSDEYILDDVFSMNPSWASLEVLGTTQILDNLDHNLPALASSWLDLEKVYVGKIKRESYKQIHTSLGYLNIYLFFYLPNWFDKNTQTKLQFPNIPNKLISAVFVSRLVDPKIESPLTLMEVMKQISLKRGWANSTYYATLKQIEIFFDFIERYADQFAGCLEFKQPLSREDYPRTARSIGTDKSPIPRRLFGFFLDYIEAVLAHLNMVHLVIIQDQVTTAEVDVYAGKGRLIIDTFAMSRITGFVPVIFVNGRTVPLRYVPNCLSLEWFPLRDGRTIRVPQPHALNQILVALYTGLRHNHIQWLDATKFDCRVTEDDEEYATLHVNTDKSKTYAWEPPVNIRVIEILRNQRAWREHIACPGFTQLHYYNNNDDTKWEKILPLFSSFADGLPHPDSRYVGVWQDILCAIQGLLPEIGESSLTHLCSLEPPNVDFQDTCARDKKKAYGLDCERAGKNMCVIGVKSDITPHSSRVTVVSHLITYLPAEIIGKYITGQSAAVVHHYVVLDNEQMRMEGIHQAMALREGAFGNAFEAFADPKISVQQGYIHADRVNSNLAKSLRENLPETLMSYGCISIVMNEDGASGLDVLRETRAANAAENKTEICPYGNHCPPEVVKMWRGPHRCGLCQYAVRSIDHLPAIAAKIKQFWEMLTDLTEKLETAKNCSLSTYSIAELDRLDDERVRLAEELAGWRVSEEVLYKTKNRIADGHDTRKWVVQTPEIILQDLQRVAVPSNMTAYTLLRLQECIAYPMTESPRARARFERLRYDLLIRSREFRKPFSAEAAIEPAAECAGLLRSIVAANHLCYDKLLEILESDSHLLALPTVPIKLIGNGDLDEED